MQPRCMREHGLGPEVIRTIRSFRASPYTFVVDARLIRLPDLQIRPHHRIPGLAPERRRELRHVRQRTVHPKLARRMGPRLDREPEGLIPPHLPTRGDSMSDDDQRGNRNMYGDPHRNAARSGGSGRPAGRISVRRRRTFETAHDHDDDRGCLPGTRSRRLEAVGRTPTACSFAFGIRFGRSPCRFPPASCTRSRTTRTGGKPTIPRAPRATLSRAEPCRLTRSPDS